MLHTVAPLAFVLGPVAVCISPLSMLLVILVVALILATVRPSVLPIAMHDSFLEGTLEIAVVSPLEYALA